MNDDLNTIQLSIECASVDLQKALREILLSLKGGIIPTKETVDELKVLFDLYFSAYFHYGTESFFNESFSKEENEEKVSWEKRVLTETAIPFENAFLRKKENIRILKRLIYEKLILSADAYTAADFIGHLIVIGYAASVKVQENEYYLLTASGWKWIISENTRDLITTQDPSFVMPNKLSASPEDWNNVTFFRLIKILQYYHHIGTQHFMVFESNAMLHGCKISDEQSVSYCISATPTGNLYRRENLRIIELCKSDAIDSIIIIVQSEEAANSMRSQICKDEPELDKLEFYIIPEVENK